MAVNPENLTAGTLVRIPGYSGHRAPVCRPYCLLLTQPGEISKATGAVSLFGEVRALDGSTARRKKLFRSTVQYPKDLELVATAPVAP
jgi:hypothetical protein